MDEAELISETDRKDLELRLAATFRRSLALRSIAAAGLPVEIARKLAGEAVASMLARRFWIRRRLPPQLRPEAQYAPALPAFEGVHDYEVATRLFWRQARSDLMAAAGVTDLGDLARSHNWPPVFNMPALGLVPVVRFDHRSRHRQMDLIRWAITPAWHASDMHPERRIAVRGDYVMEDRHWRPTLRHRRCLIIVEGYYEWCTTSHQYQPYAVARVDGQPMLIAGLWDAWRADADGEWVRSVALVTTSGNDALKRLCLHRMPLVIEPRDAPIWLGECPVDDYRIKLLMTNTVGNGVLKLWPVSEVVNSAQADGPVCLMPLPPR